VKRVKTDFPRAHTVIEHEWIPMSDGCRLAAKIWLPEDADNDPVPALLEYIPYRTSDWTAVGDSTRHAYFAGHGYAPVRVDIRGSGNSEGVLLDEYLPQEQQDAVETLAWLAAQPWCTGTTGMFGISWGGFNSLQVAARRPPSLAAIITHCSTDDRYADDVHYMGGCLLSFYMLSWASTMLTINGWPPDPDVVGESWRDLWRQRLEESPPFIEAWMSHQRRDDYWKQGSVCEDYAAIECAVYAVGGWADAYRNTVLRLLAGLPGPRKGLIGPWGHQYPEDGVPGPAIGFLQEALRWWDHWLKGIDTGIMDEPMLRAWMQEWIPPAPFAAEWPGRWVGDPSWPSPHVTAREEPFAFPVAQVSGSAAAGADAGAWCGFGAPGDPALDQRAEDGVSLCSTSEPLEERLEILGVAEVELTLASDRPAALVCVRLCDVAPDGSSLLVTRGLLNLTHREGDERPQPLVPGERYTVAVRLNSIAHAFAPGHRLRVAVSPAYWPWIWPSPEQVTLTVESGLLRLPARAPQAGDDELAPFGPPEAAEAIASELVPMPGPGRVVSHDVATGRYETTWGQDFRHGVSKLAGNGIEIGVNGLDVFSIVEGLPLSAEARSTWTATIGRDGWRVRIETESTLSADAEAFHLTSALEAYEGETRVFTRARTLAVPRDHV
jgi:putative CocE/NonD family hydrolase